MILCIIVAYCHSSCWSLERGIRQRNFRPITFTLSSPCCASIELQSVLARENLQQMWQIRWSHILFFFFFLIFSDTWKRWVNSSVQVWVHLLVVIPASAVHPRHSSCQRRLPGILSFPCLSHIVWVKNPATSCLLLTSDRGPIFGHTIRANLRATSKTLQCKWDT